jgi:HSP90 family molecular chaperone
MRVENVKREVTGSTTMQVAKATIKATPKIFDMFANDTYANKPLAIMRELVANGIDAHVAAGRADRPVEVVMPTSLDPTCRIRDFGTGMAHDFVMGPFMAYTDGSTKDKDDGAIGGFGIGSKSPFAYVDQYTLRVVHQGVLSIYTMFKDEDGIPAIGLQA